MLKNIYILSVIRQKGKSQNGCFKKTKHAKFYEKRTFLSPSHAHVSTATKKWQTLLYCHFIRISKGPGTSFLSSEMPQKRGKNVCHKIYCLTKFHFNITFGSKEITKSVTSIMHRVHDDVTDFEIICKNTNIKISREPNIIFSSNKKFHLLYLTDFSVTKYSFAEEVNF